MAKYGFSSADAFRFWIYMENIKKNYASFNKARDKYFRKNGISDFPASTGIETRLAGNRKISISLEAIKTNGSKEFEIRNLKSSLQCEAS